jgi:molybdenum cofactor cytidylyltransferase
MPCVPAEVISVVAEALSHPEALAAPFYRGRRGHPVGFGAAWATHLKSLTGDRGARDLLENASIERIDCLHDGVLRDVDLPDDLARLKHLRA